MPWPEVIYPEEGLRFGIDSLVMLVDAPHKSLACIFLNYLLDGRVSAYASDLIDYGNCNTAVRAYMTEEYKNDATVNPPQENWPRPKLSCRWTASPRRSMMKSGSNSVNKVVPMQTEGPLPSEGGLLFAWPGWRFL